MLEAIEQAIRSAPDWISAAVAGTRRYLETLADLPAFARTFLIEVPAAGTAALERRGAVHERFAALLADTHEAIRRDFPDQPALPPSVFRACVGAVNELVTDHLLRHGAATLPQLEQPILEVQIALLGGRDLVDRVTGGQGAGWNERSVAVDRREHSIAPTTAVPPQIRTRRTEPSAPLLQSKARRAGRT